MKELFKLLKDQKKTIEMAKHYADKPSKIEKFFGWVGFILFYGTCLVFGLYMIYQMIIY